MVLQGLLLALNLPGLQVLNLLGLQGLNLLGLQVLLGLLFLLEL